MTKCKCYNEYPIGTVLQARADGSYIYLSHRGVLNLDNRKELIEARLEDESLLENEQ